jgi:hypothetical protein
MKLTVGKLRQIIRESVEEIIGELSVGSRNTGPEELADILGFDWYTLTPDEKRDFGDLMMLIKADASDKRLALSLRNLPIEKHFVAAKPGGKYAAPEADDIDFEGMLRKIRSNYSI